MHILKVTIEFHGQYDLTKLKKIDTDLLRFTFKPIGEDSLRVTIKPQPNIREAIPYGFILAQLRELNKTIRKIELEQIFRL